MHSMSRHRLLVALAILICTSQAGNAIAQGRSDKYPSKPIRLLVPYAPGGGADVVTRPLTQKLGEVLGTQFVYENRGSSGGIVAVEIVARAAPDGYTLLLGSGSTQTVNPVIYSNLPYQSPKGFAPITVLANAPLVLVSNSKFPAKTLNDVIEYAKANPGKINWGSAGSGTGLLAIESFQQKAGVKVQHVPYKGSGPAYTAVLAGEIDMFMVNVGVVAGGVKDGRVRILANGGLKRLQAIPDVSTFDELGLKGYDASSWYGMLAPSATSKPIVSLLAAEAIKILKTPEMAKLYAEQGAYVVANTPEEMAIQIDRELKNWSDVAKAAGIKPEAL